MGESMKRQFSLPTVGVLLIVICFLVIGYSEAEGLWTPMKVDEKWGFREASTGKIIEHRFSQSAKRHINIT